MSEMIIHSKFKDYAVHFVNDFSDPLKDEIESGAFVIMDKNVYEIYKSRLEQILVSGRFLLLEANENNKTLDKCKEVIELLVEKKVRRNQKLIAMGGGVIQDVTAFVASILYRGLDWTFFPTTLLAQGDSCIGSKTSINLGDKKNLIGNFYPPSDIYIDTGFLESLVMDDIKSGIGEMLHFYFYADSPLVEKLIGNYHNILANRELFVDFIMGSLSIKKSVIEIDEFDKGERNKFNYGHTFGHALETITDYGIKHGQAVTVGMDIANYLSKTMGFMEEKVYEKIHSQLKINFPNYDFNRCNMDMYFNALAKDKKNIGDNLGCILAEGPGRLVRTQVPFDNNLKDILRKYFIEKLIETRKGEL